MDWCEAPVSRVQPNYSEYDVVFNTDVHGPYMNKNERQFTTSLIS